MKLQEHQSASIHIIGGHAPGRIQVNGRWLATPFLIAPALLQDTWLQGLDGLDIQSDATIPRSGRCVPRWPHARWHSR